MADDDLEPVPGAYQFEFDWFTHNIPIWLTHLRRFAGRPGITGIEIGAWEGRSAVWLLENVLTDPSSVLHCIDLWASPNGRTIEARFDRNIAIAVGRTGGRVVKRRGKSVDVLPDFDARAADVVYVDGSHIARDVLSDLMLAWRTLKPGGVLICDDYELNHGVEFHGEQLVYVEVPGLARPKMAIDAFLTCFEGTYRLLHKEWQVIVEKTAE
jgi:SAM-dependent methyltransferase